MGHMSARTEMVSIPNWYVYVSFYVLLPHILRHTHTHTHTYIHEMGPIHFHSKLFYCDCILKLYD